MSVFVLWPCWMNEGITKGEEKNEACQNEHMSRNTPKRPAVFIAWGLKVYFAHCPHQKCFEQHNIDWKITLASALVRGLWNVSSKTNLLHIILVSNTNLKFFLRIDSLFRWLKKTTTKKSFGRLNNYLFSPTFCPSLYVTTMHKLKKCKLDFDAFFWLVTTFWTANGYFLQS